jgi:hypothetical protein
MSKSPEQFNFSKKSKKEDQKIFEKLPKKEKQEFIERQPEKENRIRIQEKIKSGEARDYDEALNYVAAESLAKTDKEFEKFWEKIQSYEKDDKDNMLSKFKNFSPEFFNVGVDEIVKEEEPIRSIQMEMAEELVFSLALEDAENNTDNFLDKIDEKSKKFLKLMQLSRLFNQRIGQEYSMAVSYNDSGNGPKFYIYLGGEDIGADYDPPYIAEVRRRAKEFGESFNMFGLEEKVVNGEFAGRGRDHGPHHYADIDSIQQNLKDNLSDASRKKMQKLIKLIDSKEKEIQEKARKEAIKEKLTEISGYEKIKDLPKEKLVFIAKYLIDHEIESVGEKQIGRAGQIVAIAKTNFDTYTTRSTVTDYKVRRIHVLNVNNNTAGVSSKESVLWRTTANGLTGKNLSSEITDIKIRGNNIEVELGDGKKVVVKMKELKEIVQVNPEVKKAIQKQINKELEKLRESHKNLKIPVLGPGMKEIMYRPADVGVSNIEYDDDGKGATVTLWEEIDFRPGGKTTTYVIQKRLRTYHVTSDGISEISSETEEYDWE